VFVSLLREKLEARPTTQHHRSANDDSLRRRRARWDAFGNKVLEVGARRYEGTTAADGTLFARGWPPLRGTGGST
jgi:hypothetical protein